MRRPAHLTNGAACFAYALITLGSLGASAFAQAPQIPRYQPATPTTSRFLTLGQGATGGIVSNYFGVVRPQQRQDRLVQQQRRDFEQQLNGLQAAGSEPTVSSTGKAAWFRVGSPRNTYRDTSHYYSRWNDRRLPLRR